jgi:hypothetical protein
MMTKSNMHYARASAAAIAAALALSPTYVAASPKPIIDLSKSPAISGEPAPAAKPATPPSKKIGPVDERTAEIGGGAIVLLALGGTALAMRNRRRRREDEEAWNYGSQELTLDEPAPAANPVAEEQPAIVAPSPSAFAWGNEPAESASSDCEELETWMERAKCGPTEDNPSMSMKKRVKRAAFFEQRERDVAEGEAVPVDPDAGLPESMDEDRQLEQA